MIGGAVGAAAIAALMFGLAVLVWLMMRELFAAIGRALVDGIKSSVS